MRKRNRGSFTSETASQAKKKYGLSSALVHRPTRSGTPAPPIQRLIQPGNLIQATRIWTSRTFLGKRWSSC